MTSSVYFILALYTTPLLPPGSWLPLTLLSCVPVLFVTVKESANWKIKNDGYYLLCWIYTSSLVAQGLAECTTAAVNSGLKGENLALAITIRTQLIAGGGGYCIKVRSEATNTKFARS